MNINRKGQAGNAVSTGMQASTYTPFANTSFILPYGLRLQQKVGMVDITNVVDAGATVVYTANNNYSAGDVVSIYGVNPVAYNLQRATIESATSTTFTITTTATGTYVSGGIAQRTGKIPVTIPSGVTFVYAIVVGGGGSGAFFGNSGGGGGLAWGWTLATSSCVVGAGALQRNDGAGGDNGNFSRYGNVITGGGCTAENFPVLGGGGSSRGLRTSGSTNYWGMPGGSEFGIGFGAGAAGSSTTTGKDGISGGAGRSASGGSGMIGGGASRGGNGGSGINLLTGQNTNGGIGSGDFVNGAGGGGGGVATSGSNSSGGTGGAGGLGGGGGGGGADLFNIGGAGGAGILYLFY